MVVAGLNADLRSGRGAAVHGGDRGGRGRVHTDDLGLLDAYGKRIKVLFRFGLFSHKTSVFQRPDDLTRFNILASTFYIQKQ